MLRITHSGSIKLATLDLEGKLLGPWVDEVRAIVAKLRTKDAVRLNLRGLSFADPNGIALLHELKRDGVALSGCTPLIAGLLASRQGPTVGDGASLRTVEPTHD